MVPETNRIDISGMMKSFTAGSALETIYRSGQFIGAFQDNPDHPTWSRQEARNHLSDFLTNTPGKIFHFGEAIPHFDLKNGEGEEHDNATPAMVQWLKSGRKGVEPFSCIQNFGSCVNASEAEGTTGLLAVRASDPKYGEVYKAPVAWYHYAERGYCGDGWTGSGIAAVARRNGVAFRLVYPEIDFTDDDENERLVARTWCRSGIPSSLKAHTQKNHPFEDGAITRMQGGLTELTTLFKDGGFLHHSGTFTSGGSRPFTDGSTGPHMQTAYGYSDSDNTRQFLKDKIGITPRTNDFPVLNHQTWGYWSGACAGRYWLVATIARKFYTMDDIKSMSDAEIIQLLAASEGGWGIQPQGAWVCWASTLQRRVSWDYAWLPRVKGFPGVPSPIPVPPVTGELVADGPLTAIRGRITVNGHNYIATPHTTKPNTYVFVVEPVL